MTILTAAQMRGYASSAGFSGSGLDTIVKIAGAESRGKTDAFNAADPHGGSYGITQINGVHPGASAALNDPQSAMDQAYKISSGGTKFTDWSTYNNGTYSSYSTGTDSATSDMTYTAPADFTSGGSTTASASDTTSSTLPDCTAIDKLFGAFGFGGMAGGDCNSSTSSSSTGGGWLGNLISRSFVLLIAVVMIGIALWALNKEKMNINLSLPGARTA